MCFPPFTIFGRFLGRYCKLHHCAFGSSGICVGDGCVGAAALGIASQKSELALGKLSAYNFGNHDFLFSACCAAAPEAEGTCNGEFSLVYFSCGGTDHGYARLRGTHGQNLREKLLVRAAKLLGSQDGERPSLMRECHDAQGHVGWPLARC